MKLNSRSCVLDAFAYIMCYQPDYVAELVGHQGPEGFHTQELIEVALAEGWAVTPIERFPQATNWETEKTRSISFKGEDREERFIRHLKKVDGVLLGQRGPKPHAVAWDSSSFEIYDPSTDTRFLLFQDGKIDQWMFHPEIFLRMDERA